MAAIFSNVKRRLFGKHRIQHWKGSGLLYLSMVIGIIRTINRTRIDRRLGSVAKSDLEAVERELRRCLGL